MNPKITKHGPETFRKTTTNGPMLFSVISYFVKENLETTRQIVNIYVLIELNTFCVWFKVARVIELINYFIVNNLNYFNI